MSTNKITSDNYDIYVGPYAANNWIGTMTVHGNLDVVGNVTYIHTTDLSIDDPFITVAANNQGTFGSATFPDQGLVAQTSASTFAGLRFDNTANTWQISNLVYGNGDPINSYVDLAVSGAVTPGGANTNIQFNDGGSAFGGSSNLTFDKSTNALTLSGYQVLGNIGSAPGAVSNATVIYAAVPGGGGTGVYAQAGSNNAELVNTNSAILYSLIF